MISCAGVPALLTHLLEAALDDDLRYDVEAHLAGCGGCRDHLRRLEWTIALTRSLGDEPEPVPAGTMAVLLAAFRERHPVTAAVLERPHTRLTKRGGTL